MKFTLQTESLVRQETSRKSQLRQKTCFTASKDVDIPTKQGLYSSNSSTFSTDARAEAITANWFQLIQKEVFLFVAVSATQA